MSTTVEAPAVPNAGATATSLPAMMLDQADRRGRAVALRVKELGRWREISWQEYAEHAADLALGLLELGVARGDKVAVLAENRAEWLFADLATQAVGAVTVGVYPTSSDPELVHVLSDSAAKVIVVEDEEQLDKALAVRGQTPALTKIVVIDTRGIRSLEDPMTMSLEELEVLGSTRRRGAPNEFRESVSRIGAGDVAVVVYTSGVAGPPQGVMLSHANLVAAAHTVCDFYGARRDDEVLSYLPLCHVAERLVSVVAAVRAGYVVNFGEGGESFPNDLREVQPTFFLGVPRVWEKMMAGVQIRMRNAGWLKRTNYRLWQGRGARTAPRRMRGGGGGLSGVLGWLFLYRALRKKLGLSRIRIALSGAAPIAPEILQFFWSLGVPVREVYGQTENTALAAATPATDVRVGSVGPALPGVDIRIADDGEILVRSSGNFVGYLGNEAATREVLDADGWLHTGDLGQLDADGYLTITGRKKDLIVTAGGVNVSPNHVENLLKVSPFIREAMVIGDRRPYLTALIGIEFETVAESAKQQDLQFSTYQDLVALPEVRRLIERAVDEVNRQISDIEQIRALELFPVQLDEAGQLTATQKVRRESVVQQFDGLIERMYVG